MSNNKAPELRPCPWCKAVPQIDNEDGCGDVAHSATCFIHLFDKARVIPPDAFESWNVRADLAARDGGVNARAAAARLSIFINDDYTLIARHFKEATKDRDIGGDVEDLITHCGSSSEAEMWQAIESAPKDRTRILVCGGNCADPLSVYWDDQFTYIFDESVDPPQQRYTGAWTDDAVKSFGYEETKSYDPTHWMPLPAPSQVQLREEKGE